MATVSPSITPRPTGGPTGWLAEQVANLGAFAIGWVAGVGDVAVFALQTIGWLFARRQRRD
ncbi:MAG: hypothetical protein ACKO6E_12035, partial [Planctomycetota bacterium]